MATSRVIEKLVTEITADGDKFRTELQQTAKDAQSWGRDIQQKFATAAKVSAAGMAAMAAAAAHTFNETRQLIDEQAKLARVSNVSVREFQQGAFAVKTLGIEQDKYADILKDVNDRIGDFVATGGGPMKDFFENIAPKVGVTAEQFRNLSGKDALQLYVSSLEKANLNQQDMTFYMEAISSDSTKLLPLFRENGKAMGELADQADRLGLTMSEVDAAQVEAANDALTRAAAVAEGWGKQLTVELAPAVQAVADMYTNAALQANGYADTAALAGDIAEGAIGAIGDTWEDITLGIIESRGQLAKFVAFSLEALQQLNVFGLSDKLFGISSEEVAQAIVTWRELGEDYAAEFENGFADRAENGSFSERFAKQLEENRKALSAQAAAASGPVGVGAPVVDQAAAKALESSVARIRSEIAAAEPPLKKYSDQVAIIDSLLAAGKLSQDEYNKAISIYKNNLNDALGVNDQWKKDLADAAGFVESSKTEIEKLNEEMIRAQDLAKDGLISPDVLAKTEERIGKAIEEAEKKTGGMADIADQAARNIQDSFADFLFDPFNDGLDGMLMSFADTVRRMAAEALAADLLHSIGFGGKDNNGGNVAAFAGGISTIFGGFFADGGRPDPNKISIVGERGPELFIPKGVSGEIIPNSQLSSMAAQPPQAPPNIGVFIDPAAMTDFMATSKGRQNTVETIRLEADTIKAILG